MDKPLDWLHDRITTPPFSLAARVQAGYLLRRLQKGHSLGMPHSRTMPVIGQRCRELRIKDASAEWRIVYRVDPDAILIVSIFNKKSRETPYHEIQNARERLRRFDNA